MCNIPGYGGGGGGIFIKGVWLLLGPLFKILYPSLVHVGACCLVHAMKLS